MTSRSSSWAGVAAMLTFVLLWGSAAIVTRWALDHGSVFAVLILRFALALGALLLTGLPRRRWLPLPGTRRQVASTGVLLIGSYSISYFQALAHGITPGLLATLLGVQPILTLLLTERRFSSWRLLGLLLALSGLTLVVYQSLVRTGLSAAGMSFALSALLCMTAGAVLQKRIQQPPTDVLPLQYVMTLLVCLLFVPFQPFQSEASLRFLIPLLWLGLVISVGAQLLLYRLIRSGRHEPLLSDPGGHGDPRLPDPGQPDAQDRDGGHGDDPGRVDPGVPRSIGGRASAGSMRIRSRWRMRQAVHAATKADRGWGFVAGRPIPRPPARRGEGGKKTEGGFDLPPTPFFQEGESAEQRRLLRSRLARSRNEGAGASGRAVSGAGCG